MRARKRRTKYTWLPNFESELTADQFTNANQFSFTLPPNSTGTFGAVVPVLQDIEQFDDTTGNEIRTLAESVGSEYFLKRIVGKIFITVAGSLNQGIIVGGNVGESSDSLPAFMVTAGFYVAAEEHPTGSGVPMGFAADSDRYNPQTIDAIREPWIWRRSWLLGPVQIDNIGAIYGTTTAGVNNVTITAGHVVGLGTLPSSNTHYHSVLDGPHCDAKTARRVRQHERLWFTVFAFQVGSPTAAQADNWDEFRVNVATDCRYLGALRRAKNRSAIE